MYCYHHPESPAAGVCVDCNNPVCPECKVEYQGRIFCNSCIEKRVAATGATIIQQPSNPAYENTSGTGSKAVVPPGLGDWNWGGFLLTWIWGIGNNVWWAFLVFIPYLGFLVMPWVLAFKGNEWAWQSKRWESVEHFKRVQHTWAMWGLWITIASTILVFLILALVAGLIIYGVQSSGMRWY
jgi:hypothetical protein